MEPLKGLSQQCFRWSRSLSIGEKMQKRAHSTIPLVNVHTDVYVLLRKHHGKHRIRTLGH